MRIVKTRLREMMPTVQVFLDVDALGNTKLRDFEHVDLCNVVLVFLTQGFFKSGPCAREIVRAIMLDKPIIALLETDAAKGGLTEDECRGIIAKPTEDGTTWFTEKKWRAGTFFLLKDQAAIWAQEWKRPDLKVPTSMEVADAVFKLPPINWYPLSDLQEYALPRPNPGLMKTLPVPRCRSMNLLVTLGRLTFIVGSVSMRLIAQLLLPTPSAAPTVPSSCVGSRTPPFIVKALRRKGSKISGRRARRASEVAATDEPVTNDGEPDQVEARTYMDGEVAQMIKRNPIQLKPLGSGRRFHFFCSPNNLGAQDVGEELKRVVADIKFTTDFEQLTACERMLLHLHENTWTQPESAELAHEVAVAMRTGVNLLLLHEVRSGRRGDNERRAACSFTRLIEETPKHLLAAGVYNRMIALNLAGDEWRQTGLIRGAQWMADSSGERQPVEVRQSLAEEGGGHPGERSSATLRTVARGGAVTDVPCNLSAAAHESGPSLPSDALLHRALHWRRQRSIERQQQLGSTPRTAQWRTAPSQPPIDPMAVVEAQSEAMVAPLAQQQLARSLRAVGQLARAVPARSSTRISPAIEQEGRPSQADQGQQVGDFDRTLSLEADANSLRSLPLSRQWPERAAPVLHATSIATTFQRKLDMRQQQRGRVSAADASMAKLGTNVPAAAAVNAGTAKGESTTSLQAAVAPVQATPVLEPSQLEDAERAGHEAAALIIQGHVRSRQSQRQQTRQAHEQQIKRLKQQGLLALPKTLTSSASQPQSTERILRPWDSASSEDDLSSSRLPLSAGEAATRTQFDILFASQAGGVLGAINGHVLHDCPVEEGWHGGGGLRLTVWALEEEATVHNADVVAGAAHRWTGAHSRWRKMSVGREATRRFSSTLVAPAQGEDAALAAAAVPDED